MGFAPVFLLAENDTVNGAKWEHEPFGANMSGARPSARAETHLYRYIDFTAGGTPMRRSGILSPAEYGYAWSKVTRGANRHTRGIIFSA